MDSWSWGVRSSPFIGHREHFKKKKDTVVDQRIKWMNEWINEFMAALCWRRSCLCLGAYFTMTGRYKPELHSELVPPCPSSVRLKSSRAGRTTPFHKASSTKHKHRESWPVSLSSSAGLPALFIPIFSGYVLDPLIWVLMFPSLLTPESVWVTWFNCSRPSSFHL